MRRIPDIIIAIAVIVGATGIATGFRWIGVISLGIALLVGWKRDWCMESFEGMMSSSESSSINEMHDTDAGHDGAADGEH